MPGTTRDSEPADLPVADTPDQRDPWGTLMAELDWWIEEHGSSYVPQTATSRVVDGKPYPLGRRLTQRRYDYRNGALSAQQIRDLEQRPGWSWSGFRQRAVAAGTAQLATITAFYDQRGSLDGLESAHPVAARWLRDQRAAELTPAEHRRLARIPGALEDRRTRVDQFVAAVRGWIDQEPERDASALRYGTVHTVDRARVPIGKRAAYYRARHAAGRLGPATARAIEHLPGWEWAPPEQRRPGPTDGPHPGPDRSHRS